MPEWSTLMVFSGAALLLFVVPGPAVLYILARSVSQGPRAGLVSVAGIHAGSLVHVGAAVVGLSALLVSSAVAFTVIKWAGAAYLVWLGIQALRHRGGGDLAMPEVERRSYRRIFRDGFVVNLLNPKTAVFFLAFLPQFVDPSAGAVTTQLLILGTAFIVIGSISDGVYALAGGVVGRWLERHPAAASRQHLVTGVTYLGLGAVAAFSGE